MIWARIWLCSEGSRAASASSTAMACFSPGEALPVVESEVSASRMAVTVVAVLLSAFSSPARLAPVGRDR